MKEYQGYLFDMDGTLVDSEPLKGEALSQACKDFGAKVDRNIYKDVIGESWSVVTDHFFNKADIKPDLNEFDEHFKDHYEQLLEENLELSQGVKAYIERLSTEGKKCGVVSSAKTCMVEKILEDCNLSDFFEVIITEEHVTEHKPDPEAYNLALDKLRLAPENVLIFEDTSAGIEAGVASGCDVFAIIHDFNGNNDLSKAIRIIKSYDDISI